MSEAALHVFTLAEFLSWQAGLEDRFELVDGRPRAMTGATFGHDRVVVNIISALRDALDRSGSGCDVATSDIGVVTGPRTLRRPDAAVYCPPFDDLSDRANNPHLVIEVLSASTRDVDQAVKLEEYKALPGCSYVILVNPMQIDVAVWSRVSPSAWELAEYTSATAEIDLPLLGLRISAAAIYRRTDARPALRPRLVWPDEG